jgi:hypothetical protein
MRERTERMKKPARIRRSRSARAGAGPQYTQPTPAVGTSQTPPVSARPPLALRGIMGG